MGLLKYKNKNSIPTSIVSDRGRIHWSVILISTAAVLAIMTMGIRTIAGSGEEIQGQTAIMQPGFQKAGFHLGYRSPYFRKNESKAKYPRPVFEKIPDQPSALSDNKETKQTTDTASLAAGKQIFITSCAVCHGHNGEGLIGPNMTDPYWIHGGKIADLVKVINEGVLVKGMIPWKTTLSPDQINQVASYILSLQGTNPPNGKAPEGDLSPGS